MDDLISRQQAIDDIWTVSPLACLDRKWVDRWLRQLPSAQPEIIRCKDCKYHYKGICPIERYFSLDGFCSRGER